MEAVGQLTGGLAHDFNNLFATIIPNLELAQQRIKDLKANEYLATAIRSVDRGAKLMQQLLAFSRRDELMTEPVDVNYLTAHFGIADGIVQNHAAPLRKIDNRLHVGSRVVFFIAEKIGWRLSIDL